MRFEFMRENRKDKKAFTLIELLVVMSIISMLVAILMPSLHRARSQARALICKSNLRNIYLGYMYYAADNDDSIPSTTKTRRLGGYCGFRAAKGYKEPYDRRGLAETYGLNALFDDLKYIPSESEVWICPDLGMKWMADYGCTYSFSQAAILGMHKFSYLGKKYRTSILVSDNVTVYPPSPTGWYVERTSRPISAIPQNERKEPHRYLASKRKDQYGQPIIDMGTWMTVTVDGWVGPNAENRERD